MIDFGQRPWSGYTELGTCKRLTAAGIGPYLAMLITLADDQGGTIPDRWRRIMDDDQSAPLDDDERETAKEYEALCAQYLASHPDAPRDALDGGAAKLLTSLIRQKPTGEQQKPSESDPQPARTAETKPRIVCRNYAPIRHIRQTDEWQRLVAHGMGRTYALLIVALIERGIDYDPVATRVAAGTSDAWLGGNDAIIRDKMARVYSADCGYDGEAFISTAYVYLIEIAEYCKRMGIPHMTLASLWVRQALRPA